MPSLTELCLACPSSEAWETRCAAAEVLRRMRLARGGVTPRTAQCSRRAVASLRLRKTHVELLCDKDRRPKPNRSSRSAAREKDIQHHYRFGDSRLPGPPAGRSRIRRSCCMCAAGGRISTLCPASPSSARGKATRVRRAGRRDQIGADAGPKAGFDHGQRHGARQRRARRTAVRCRAGGLTVAVLAGGPGCVLSAAAPQP